MRVISKANREIEKLWGQGKITETDYRLCTYLISADIDDGTLLQHTVTGELIFLDAAETQLIQTLPCAYVPWMEELIRKHFLVRTSADDKKNVETLRTALHTVTGSSLLTGYTILPTTCCNAHCFYCYEAGVTQLSMSDETAGQLVEFIDAHHGSRPVNISWFGGEPLVCIRQIDRISKALQQRKISFSSSMTSNGYLFSEQTASRAKSDWNLQKIQITLDGTEQIYNETKAYRNPCGSPYRKVMDNIDLLLQNEIRVQVRMNLGLHNAEDLISLTRELAERFSGRSNFSVYVHLLYDDCGFEPAHFENADLDFLEQKKEELETFIEQCSLSLLVKKLPMLKVSRCMADSSSSVVVLPSGLLGKCEHYTETNTVGSLTEGITNKTLLKQFQKHEVTENCYLCPLYPSCIKLSLCEPDHSCSEWAARIRILELRRAMKRAYEKELRGTGQVSQDK